MFELVVLLLIGHMRGSTGAHHLRSRPCFSSSVQHVGIKNTHTRTRVHTYIDRTKAHTHTHKHIYIYIYIYIWLNIRNIFAFVFFVNPFKLPYQSYDIRQELVDKPSIISYFPSTFCSTLGHHHGRMYYKSDVTFVCTLLLCKNGRLCWCIV